MVVIEQNPAELTELYDNTSSISAVLSSVSVGQTGYVFAISGKDYVVSYHPNAELIGSDALSDGMNVSNLENGTFTWLLLMGNVCIVAFLKLRERTMFLQFPKAN